jgi:hypothetical protein
MRWLPVLLICIVLGPVSAQAQVVVEHLTGRETQGYRDGFGTQARFSSLNGIWADASNVFISDEGNRVIRKLTIATGEVSTFAGTPQDGTSFAPGSMWGDGISLYVIDSYFWIHELHLGSGTIISSVNATYNMPPSTRPISPFEIRGNSANLYALYGPQCCTPPDPNAASIREISRSTGEGPFLNFPHDNGNPKGLWADDEFLYVTFVTSDTVTMQRMNLVTREWEKIFQSLLPIKGPSGFFSFIPLSHLWSDNQGHFFFTAWGALLRIDILNGRMTQITSGSDIGPIWGVGEHLFACGTYDVLDIDIPTGEVRTIAGIPRVLQSSSNPLSEVHGVKGSGSFLYAISGYALCKVSTRTRGIQLLAGSPTEQGVLDGRGSAARFSSPGAVWANDQYVYVGEFVFGGAPKLRRVDVQTGDVITIPTDLPTNLSINAAWGDGNYLYVPDHSTLIYQIDVRTGAHSTFATGLVRPSAIWGDSDYLYTFDGDCSTLRKVNRNSRAAQAVATLSSCAAGGITGDGQLLYVTDGPTVRSVDPGTGQVLTIAGNPRFSGTEDGNGTDARFLSPGSIWSDGTNLYVQDSDSIRRIVLTHTRATVQFDFPESGADYWKTARPSDPMVMGYGRVRLNTGSSTVGAVAVFSSRPNGVLVSEASVPAVAPIQQGRIYVEVNGSTNTGIAMANANDQPAAISFYFTDSSGVNFGSNSMTVAANSQISTFLNEPRATTFTFSSSVPVGVIALRGYMNERSEFLMTTLPVVPLTASTSPSSVLIPHYADGGGWQTRVLLVNPTDTAMRGIVEMDSTSSYTIAPRSSVSVVSPGTSPTLRMGTIRITAVPFSSTPAVSAVFSFRESGVVVTETGIPTKQIGRSFRMFAQTGRVRTGVAVANASSTTGTVEFDVLDADGQLIASSMHVTLSASSRLSLFIDEIPGLTGLPADVRGVLKIASDVPVSVMGIRSQYNERNEFIMSTTPVFSDATPASVIDAIFPDIVSGGGYTTEFLLLSGSGRGMGVVEFSSPLPIQQ